MKTSILLAPLLAAHLIACGSSSPAPEAPVATATTSEAADVILVIEAANVSFPAPADGSGTEHSIELRASGEAFIDGAPTVTLNSDGTVHNGASEVIAQITKDGALTFTGAEDDALVISEDGTMTSGGRSMSFFPEDGSFQIPSSGQVGSYDGSPSARRALVVVFATSMRAMKPETTVGPVETKATAPNESAE